MLPEMRVDAGAIKFVLRGADIMCPGLTSAGGRMTRLPVNTVCVRTLNHSSGLILAKFRCLFWVVKLQFAIR